MAADVSATAGLAASASGDANARRVPSKMVRGRNLGSALGSLRTLTSCRLGIGWPLVEVRTSNRARGSRAAPALSPWLAKVRDDGPIYERFDPAPLVSCLPLIPLVFC